MNQTPSNTRIDFLGCPLDLLAEQALIEDATRALNGGVRIRLEGLNVAKLIDARATPFLMRALHEAERIHIDGAGIAIGLKWLDIPAPPRCAGIDLMHKLCALAVKTNASVYLLGARTGVVGSAAQRLVSQYPGLRIVGVRDGYFRAEEEAAVVEDIRASGADLLFVGMSSPKKELLLQQYWPQLGVKIGMGVGGSFDVISGELKRAPYWMQKLGMEWCFRLYQEPQRLFWRYIKTNFFYMLLLLHARSQNLINK
ncbi:UDP-N-acetyl-D-mannosamine transferase [Pseudomonas sp. HMWF032]|uniref:WecB/TagA/CpsF family glycosyltransferase n=1 Tax=Pseudomonas sp. HMWF032 TaxID=2056866 RepID=UPI000D3A5D8C|nr:WecB/TagA/CpsF family glycosyltransferase [Pseudomonas sp. HMWF032]PTS82280.1 UDP-N-acetyl-D-mannosamine transferase [Pseudomonas sp. HMWF032]PTT84307.1 UDP-N-acetyl-D-mannosamine transferase [Pseudomonas sp. HMWF010]